MLTLKSTWIHIRADADSRLMQRVVLDVALALLLAAVLDQFVAALMGA